MWVTECKVDNVGHRMQGANAMLGTHVVLATHVVLGKSVVLGADHVTNQ